MSIVQIYASCADQPANNIRFCKRSLLVLATFVGAERWEVEFLEPYPFNGAVTHSKRTVERE